MHTRIYLAVLGIAGLMAVVAAPAQAHSSVSFGINVGHGYYQPHGYVHYHGGRACTVRHRYYDAWPYHYGPRVRYRPYAPPPPVVFGDDCRWYRGRWHCY